MKKLSTPQQNSFTHTHTLNCQNGTNKPLIFNANYFMKSLLFVEKMELHLNFFLFLMFTEP